MTYVVMVYITTHTITENQRLNAEYRKYNAVIAINYVQRMTVYSVHSSKQCSQQYEHILTHYVAGRTLLI